MFLFGTQWKKLFIFLKKYSFPYSCRYYQLWPTWDLWINARVVSCFAVRNRYLHIQLHWEQIKNKFLQGIRYCLNVWSTASRLPLRSWLYIDIYWGWHFILPVDVGTVCLLSMSLYSACRWSEVANTLDALDILSYIFQINLFSTVLSVSQE